MEIALHQGYRCGRTARRVCSMCARRSAGRALHLVEQASSRSSSTHDAPFDHNGTKLSFPYLYTMVPLNSTSARDAADEHEATMAHGSGWQRSSGARARQRSTTGRRRRAPPRGGHPASRIPASGGSATTSRRPSNRARRSDRVGLRWKVSAPACLRARKVCLMTASPRAFF